MKLLILTNLLSLAVIAVLVAYVLKVRYRHRKIAESLPEEAPVKPEVVADEIALKVIEWMWHGSSVPSNDMLTLESVANSIGVSREELAAYLKEHQHPNFRSWISSIRLQHCYDLLTTTDYTLSEIAYKCGYADLPTMSKAFKRQYGQSPSRFRKI